MVFLSQASASNARDLRHSVFISTDAASASPPADEAILQNMILRNQAGSVDTFNSNLNNTILPPRDPYSSSQNITTENVGYYIPNPLDYTTRIGNNDSVPLWIPSPSGQAMSGTRSPLTPFSTIPGLFQLSVATNESISPTLVETNNRLESCLRRVLPPTVSVLGRPLYQLNSRPEVQIVLTYFPGANGNKTIGLFSSLDRFKTKGGRDLLDSNKGEILYLKIPDNYSASCSTAAHEYQHLISFDHKVLSQLPEESRFDLQEQMNRDVRPEDLGLNEGYSHIVEELSGEYQEVDRHIYRFLTQPSGTARALESVWSDMNANSRSRGLNTLLHYYGIRRAGGTLSLQDPATQNYLKSLILSSKTGLENIASFFNTTPNDYLEDFFVQLATTLYNPSRSSEFIPPPEVSGQMTRGISFLDRTTPYESLTLPNNLTNNAVHPLQFSAPLVTAQNYVEVPAQSVVFMRYIVPKGIRGNSEMKIFANGKPFIFFMIPVR